MGTINLYFKGEQKPVNLKTVISRKVIKSVETPIATLRSLGQNMSFMDAMRRSPNAAKIVTLSGGMNTQYANTIKQQITAEITNISEADLNTMITQRIQSELLESFPEVWDALQNPVTEFPLDNDQAINACIDIVKIIIDDSQLTEEQKTLMALNEFWDEQDLTEVARVVRSFRGETKL